MYIGLYVEYRLFLSDFNETWIFSIIFRKTKYPILLNFMKIRPVGAELFHADGQTWQSFNSRFSQYFANAPKNDLLGIIWEVCKWFGLAQDLGLEARFDTGTVQFRICTNSRFVPHTSKRFHINTMYIHTVISQSDFILVLSQIS